jgi:hypothetical protein
MLARNLVFVFVGVLSASPVLAQMPPDPAPRIAAQKEALGKLAAIARGTRWVIGSRARAHQVL